MLIPFPTNPLPLTLLPPRTSEPPQLRLDAQVARLSAPGPDGEPTNKRVRKRIMAKIGTLKKELAAAGGAKRGADDVAADAPVAKQARRGGTASKRTTPQGADPAETAARTAAMAAIDLDLREALVSSGVTPSPTGVAWTAGSGAAPLTKAVRKKKILQLNKQLKQ